MDTRHDIGSLAALEALYGKANPNSLAKETARLTPAYRRWLEGAPFLAIATSGPGGLDCSPRGDAGGRLVAVLDEATIAIPDRRGNNRLDTLRNIVADPRVGLLFLMPGVNETLRINGRARITTDPELIARFAVGDKAPATVIVVGIETVYFQCSRALLRARIWEVDARRDAGSVPTPGQMLRDALGTFEAEAFDADLSSRLPNQLY